MKPEAIEAKPAITAREAELEAMRRMLVASGGCFSLSVAVCGAFLRDQIIHQLQAGGDGIEVVAVPQGTVDVFGAITSALGDRTPSALFVVGLEESVEAEAYAALRSLNASRELLERRFPCPVVFWVPASVATLIASHAPDFWRYHSHQFEFTLEDSQIVGQPSVAYSGGVKAAGQLVADAKQLRIAELEDRLTEAERPSGIAPPMTHFLLWIDELAYLYWFVGRLDHAEEMHRKSLALNEKLGFQEGMAAQYGNLGLVYAMRDDLDRAEEMMRKALTLVEKLGRQEGMASNYGNLGLLYMERGDLDRAEGMLRKSLAINKKLGRQEGMAKQFGNLGLVYKSRGDLDRAEEMYRKALALNEKLGRPDGIAIQYGNLGVIYTRRGDLDSAEVMYRKSLAIEEKLGRQEGAAIDYANLGLIYEKRGDLDEARHLWTMARDLYERIGMKHMVQKMGDWLGRLEDEK